MKECGGCTLCCYFMAITEFDSPEYSYCKNCVPNVGCAIWKDRPNVCRNTDCVWLKEEQIPDIFRPDRCGVMFELPSQSSVYVGHVDPDNPEVWNSPELSIFIKKINESGHSVVICTSNKSKTFYSLSKGDTIDNVKKELLRSIKFHKDRGLI